jgi:hypothetical protein
MKQFTFIILGLFSTYSFAEINKKDDEHKYIPVPSDIKEGEFALFNGTKYQTYAFYEYEDLLLSPDCKKSGKPTCLAYKAAFLPKPTLKRESNMMPASVLCSELKGKNLIGFNFKKQEFNFCEFEDKSMVNSWSLFRKVFPD